MKELLKIMQKDLSPNPFLSFLAIIFFLGFVGVNLLAIRNSVTGERFSYGRYAKHLPFIILSLILWLLSLFWA